MSSSSTRTSSTSTESAPGKPILTINKVVAGAGAAVTAAGAGSFFGADGTIVGAAVGSVISTTAAAMYERSLDRTRQTVHARIRPSGGNAAASQDAERSPEPGSAAGAPSLPPPSDQPPAAQRRRMPRLVGATVLIFLLAVLGVTGIELIKGSQLVNSGQGTSVGSVIGGNEERSGGSSSDEDSTTERPTRSTEPSGSVDPSSSVPGPEDTGRGGLLPVDPEGRSTLRPGAATKPQNQR